MSGRPATHDAQQQTPGPTGDAPTPDGAPGDAPTPDGAPGDAPTPDGAPGPTGAPTPPGPPGPDRQPAEPPLRFPGYDVLEQQAHWDKRTKQTVLGRLDPPRNATFCSPTEEAVCRPLLDRLLANDDPASKVPVFELVDQRLAAGRTDGWYHDDMPPDADAWHRSLAELIEQGFECLSRPAQNDFLEGVTAAKSFAGMPAAKVWNLWLRYACTAYYSHPWAWSEIGFGGPAYPRGYRNIGVGKREPWEVAEAGAEDPMPWIHRVEAARGRHQSGGT